MNNLLAQHKEIKRLEREMERNAADAHEVAQQNDDEARDRAIKDFENVQTGFNGKLGTGADRKLSKNEQADEGAEKRSGREAGFDSPERPEKKIRRFEIDENELSRIIRDERSRAKMVISKEKVSAQRIFDTKYTAFADNSYSLSRKRQSQVYRPFGYHLKHQVQITAVRRILRESFILYVHVPISTQFIDTR